MKFLVGFIFMVLMSIAGYGQTSCCCLPADIKADTVVDTVMVASATGTQTVVPVTVKQTLKKLKAKCSKGKLRDGKGKEIRFVQLQGCWGNPPQDYLEIMQKQRTDLDDLKKRYTVVEITCNPSGLPIP